MYLWVGGGIPLSYRIGSSGKVEKGKFQSKRLGEGPFLLQAKAWKRRGGEISKEKKEGRLLLSHLERQERKSRAWWV